MSKKNRWTLWAATALLVLAPVIVAHGDEDHAAATLEGEVLDMACYVAHEGSGPDHADCAKRCVKGGQPMGLLTEDGTVYLLYASHKDPSAFEATKEFAGKKVQVTGTKASKAGINGFEVLSVKGL